MTTYVDDRYLDLWDAETVRIRRYVASDEDDRFLRLCERGDRDLDCLRQALGELAGKHDEASQMLPSRGLMVACHHGQPAAVKLLLDHPSANPNVRNLVDSTLLHALCIHQTGDFLACCKLLLACPRFVQLNATTGTRMTALTLAMDGATPRQRQQAQLVDLLLQQPGIDPFAEDRVFYYAARHPDTQVTRLLVHWVIAHPASHAKARMDLVGGGLDDKHRALQLAVQHNNPQKTDMLLHCYRVLQAPLPVQAVARIVHAVPWAGPATLSRLLLEVEGRQPQPRPHLIQGHLPAWCEQRVFTIPARRHLRTLLENGWLHVERMPLDDLRHLLRQEPGIVELVLAACSGPLNRDIFFAVTSMWAHLSAKLDNGERAREEEGETWTPATVGLLEENMMAIHPPDFSKKLRTRLLWASRPARLFAHVVLLCDGFFDLCQPTPDGGDQTGREEKARRFLHIATQLPQELQMVLCNRSLGLGRNLIAHADREIAFRRAGGWAARKGTVSQLFM